MLSPSSSNVSDSVRDAVNAVLVRRLPAETAAQALELWQRGYAGKRLSGLVGFMRDLGTIAAMSPSVKHALRMDLYRALAEMPTVSGAASPSPESRQRANPSGAGSVSTGILQQQAAQVPPSVVVFEALCRGIIEGAQRTGFTEYSDFNAVLGEQLPDAKLPTLVQQNLRDWASHRAELLRAAVPEDKLSPLVHIFYLAVCEAAGPIAGDSILQHAIHQATALPEARIFDPRNLL